MPASPRGAGGDFSSCLLTTDSCLRYHYPQEGTNRRMATAIEKLGQILIQRGILTRAQFDACALEYARQVQAGASLRLSEVIVSRGFAHPGPLSESLRAAAALPFACLTCGKPSTLEPPRLDAVL